MPIVIVDEDNNEIGKSTITAATTKGQVVRIARVMVVDSAGDKVLLQKRADSSRVFPGAWDNSSAGHQDAGETVEDAAKRELKEEIGIETNNIQFIGKYYSEMNYKDMKLRRFNYVYKYISDDTPTNLQASEVSEVKWFKIDKLKQLIKNEPDSFTDGVIDAISKYF